MTFHSFFENMSLSIEVIGVLVIFFGILRGFYHAFLSFFTRKNGENIYKNIRIEIAHAILLGLEILIAVDIIKTVTTELNLQNMVTLGLIVLIRTILSISLEVEIEGKFPWQTEQNFPKK